MLTIHIVYPSYHVHLLHNNLADYYITAGVHPCRATEPDLYKEGPEAYFKEIEKMFETYKDKIIAVGECGLDYDRLHYAPKESQLKYRNLFYIDIFRFISISQKKQNFQCIYI